MFQSIKDKIAQKAYAQKLKDYTPKPIDKISDVGIIVDLEVFEDPKSLKKLVSLFEKEFNSVKVILVTSGGTSLETGIDLHFDKTQMDWHGNFKINSDANKFQQGRFDLLVNYYTEASPILSLLSASLETSLRVGLACENCQVNDFELIVKPDNIEKFIAGIRTYLPKIKH